METVKHPPSPWPKVSRICATISASFIVLVGCSKPDTVGTSPFDDYFHGKATGAQFAYMVRSSNAEYLPRLAEQLRNAKTPRGSADALDAWEMSISAEQAPGEAQWLSDLRKKEQKQILLFLAKQNVTEEEFENLRKKISALSSPFTKKEQSLLSELTSPAGLNGLVAYQYPTLEGIFEKLKEMGATEKELSSFLGPTPDGRKLSRPAAPRIEDLNYTYVPF